MNPRMVIVVASLVASLLGEAYNLWSRYKLKRQFEREVLRRNYTIAESQISDDKLDEDQLSIREMLVRGGTYNTAG